MADDIIFRDRISCTIPEACKGTGITRSRLYEMIAAGKVITTKLGKQRLVIVRSLIAALDPQPEQGRAA